MKNFEENNLKSEENGIVKLLNPETRDRMAEIGDRFHAHLDICPQCRNHPCHLCPEGQSILMEMNKI